MRLFSIAPPNLFGHTREAMTIALVSPSMMNMPRNWKPLTFGKFAFHFQPCEKTGKVTVNVLTRGTVIATTKHQVSHAQFIRSEILEAGAIE